MHLLVAYPPTLAISVLAQRLKRRTAHAARREYTGVCPRPDARPPVAVVLLRRLLRRGAAVHHQAIHRPTSPTSLNAGLRPPKHEMGSPRTEVQDLRPRFRSTVAPTCPRGLGLGAQTLSVGADPIEFAAQPRQGCLPVPPLRG